jgi:hypothetical protein
MSKKQLKYLAEDYLKLMYYSWSGYIAVAPFFCALLLNGVDMFRGKKLRLICILT